MEENNNTVTKPAQIFKAGIWYVVCSFITKGLIFITTPIFTRFMSTAEYGEYSNIVAWVGILTIVTTMDMFVTVNRARYDYKNIDGYIASIAVVGSAATLLCWLVVLLFPDFFTSFFAMDMKYINAIFACIMVTPALSIFQAKCRIKYQYKTYTILALGSALLATSVSLIMVLILDDKLLGRFSGHFGTVFLIDLGVYIYILIKGKRIKWSECKYAILICLPMIPHLLSRYILNQSDRIMIKQFCGAEDVAFYSVAYNCAMIPNILAVAANSAWSPWVGEHLHSGKLDGIRKMSVYYIGFFEILIVAIFLAGPELIYIMGGSKYAEAIWVLPPVVMGATFQLLSSLYIGLEQFAKKTIGMAIVSILAASINVLLNWLLIPKFGYLAAAYTTLVGYLIMLVFHMFLVKWTGYEKAYNTLFVMLSLLVLVGIMVVSLFIYPYPIIRYLILAIYIVFIGIFLFSKRALVNKILSDKKK